MALVLAGSASASEFNPPTVISTSPSNGATDVPVTSPVTINYSENIVQGTYYSSISLEHSDNSGIYEQPISTSISGNHLTITPNNPLQANTQYTVYIPGGAVKNTGGIWNSNYRYSFTTQADTSPPTIHSTDPANGATAVPVTLPVRVRFSENVFPGANYGSVYIEFMNSFGVAYPPVTRSISNDILTITPNKPLGPGIKYTVRIPKYAVKDAAGNQFSSDYSFTFTTVDTSPPTIHSTDPANGATAVPVTLPVRVRFSENVFPGANYGSVYIEFMNSFGVAYPPVTRSISNDILTITPNKPLGPGIKYTVRIPKYAVKDAAGNQFSSDYFFTFTTVDTSPPTIHSTDPANGATAVPVTSPITISFNENIKKGANFSKIYVIKKTTGKKVAISSKTIKGNMLTLKFAGNRQKNTIYQVVIPAAAVKDNAGNNLQSAYSFKFKTRK